MNLNLKGKNALVGGSSRGIGKAAAIELALLGANVTLLSRSASVMADIVHLLDHSQGQHHDFMVVDFADIHDMRRKFRNLTTAKIIHILVNNSGGLAAGPLWQDSEDGTSQNISRHLLAHHLLTMMAVKGMQRAGYGRVINLISPTLQQTPIAPLQEGDFTGDYLEWTRSMVRELGHTGITFNNILPGATATSQLKEIISDQAQKNAKAPGDIQQSLEEEIPLGRFAQPAEIGAVIAFLASPAAAYINGVNLLVDGGKANGKLNPDFSPSGF